MNIAVRYTGAAEPPEMRRGLSADAVVRTHALGGGGKDHFDGDLAVVGATVLHEHEAHIRVPADVAVVHVLALRDVGQDALAWRCMPHPTTFS